MLTGLLACGSLPAQTECAYRNADLPVEQRVDDLLGRMTLEEKIAQMRHLHEFPLTSDGQLDEAKLDAMLQGRGAGFVEGITLPGRDCQRLMSQIQRYMRHKTRLGIPVFTVTESLHGSVNDGSTIFPQAVALGSTFNPDLAYQMTTAIAEELTAQGVKQSLSPVVDVCRDLRFGRVEECFGEDPFLVSQMGVAQVKGYLDHGVSPMIKHFGAHAAPYGGLNLSSVPCSERELLSVHLRPFEAIMRQTRLWAVMSSYNSWNHQPNSSSSYLLTELLRNRWGFQGYVYSDWGAIGMLDYFHHVARNKAEAAMLALQAGLDAEASDNCFTELQQLVESGLLDVKYIDRAVRRILTAKFAMGLFEYELPSAARYAQAVHTPEHVSLARRIAEESIVLLKNEGRVLPLRIDELHDLALVGPNADQVQFGDYTWSRDNKDGVTLRAALARRLQGKVRLHYARGCDLVTADRSGIAAAVEAARRSDVCVVVVGSASASLARDYSNATCGEGFDLSDLRLTGVQDELIQAVCATGKPVVVVLLSGKPFAIPWVKEHVPAVLAQWYPGEQGGEALAGVLLGEVNPSGKLNYSFPQSVGHLPCFYNYLPTDKGFYHVPGSPEKPGKDYVFSSPRSLWAFGHGLSYTEFEYLSAVTSKDDYGPDEVIDVEVKIRNTGGQDGMEVPQVYVRDVHASVVTPVHELKAFRKVMIRKGETATVRLSIPVAELALYDRNMKKVVEPGAFELQIGRASDDIRIKKVVTVERHKETHIPTLADRKRKTAPAPVLVTAVKVRGVVRDVQANPLPDVAVSVGNRRVTTDAKGNYAVSALSTDTLIIGGGRYKEERIPIEGRQVIHVRLQNQ